MLVKWVRRDFLLIEITMKVQKVRRVVFTQGLGVNITYRCR